MRATWPQENLFSDLELSQNKAKYNLVYIFRVIDPNKQFSVERFIQSWGKLLDHTDALRAYFILEGDELMQYLQSPCVPPPFTYEESAYEDSDTLTDRLTEEGLAIQFNLSKPPLWDLKIVQASTDTYYIRLTFSHIITDAISLRLILLNLSNIYNLLPLEGALAKPARLLERYLHEEKDFESSSLYCEAKQYYAQLVKGKSLGFHFSKPINEGAVFQRTYNRIEESLWEEIVSQSCSKGCTPFVFILSSFTLFISRYFQNFRISLGYPIGKRGPGLEELSGYFVNVLPLIIELDETDRFQNVLEKVKKCHDQNLRYRQINQKHLKNIYREQNTSSFSPHFDVIFSSTILDSCHLQMEGCDVSSVLPNIAIPQANLICYIDLETRTLCLEFNNEKTSTAAAQAFLKSFKFFLSQAIEDKKYKEFLFISQKALQRAANLEEGAAFKPFVEIFDEQVRKNPNSIALTFRENSLSYQLLDTASDNLARILHQKGIQKKDIIAIYLQKSFEFYVAILAILKTGAAYLPLDVEAPPARILNILQRAQAKFLLSSTYETNQHIAKSADVRCILVNTQELLRSCGTEAPKKRSKIEISADDPAYVIFTSGSTGEPKGVLINHGSLSNLAQAQGKIIRINPSDRVLAFAPPYFDASVSEWSTTWANGAALVVPDQLSQKDLCANLIEISNTERVNIITLPPPVISLLSPQDLSTLHTVLVAGELIQKGVIDTWYDRVRLFNAYGPTEGTVCSTMHQITYKEALVSNVGRPLDGVKIAICDTYLQPLPLEAVGEICLGGVCLSPGYINNPDQNQQSFFLNEKNERFYRTGDIGYLDKNDHLHILGRRDSQIKIRGNRVDLLEIDSVLSRRDHIKSYFTFFLPETNEIISFLIQDPNTDNELTIKKHLANNLPSYMIPNRVIFVKAFPLSLNGKVDVLALKGQLRDSRAGEADNTIRISDPEPRIGLKELDLSLANLWCRLLKIPLEEINPKDSFFDLGGDSLKATRLILEVKKEFQIRIDTKAFFEDPSLYCLNNLIFQKGAQSSSERPLNAHDLETGEINVASRYSECRNILLTGSTGFLGAYLLRDLISAPHIERIFCIVRADNDIQGYNRVVDNLKKYFNVDHWDFSKMVVYAGDIGAECFGLSQTNYLSLAGTVSQVVHCATHVHHIYNYQKLYKDNVQSTKNIIQFSALHSRKSIHYISALSAVNDLKDGCITESFPTDQKCHLLDGYSQTKWASEVLLKQAMQNSIEVTIYRPPTLWGDTSMNHFPHANDHQFILLETFFDSGLAPDWEREIMVLPVDYVARFIGYVLGEGTYANKVYNLVPKTRFKAAELIAIFSQVLRSKIQLCPPSQWVNHISCYGEGHPIYPLISLYTAMNREHLERGGAKIGTESLRNFEKLKGQIFPYTEDFEDGAYFKNIIKTMIGGSCARKVS